LFRLVTEVPEGAAHYTAVFVNVNTCSRTSCCFPIRRNPSFPKHSTSPGRASYSMFSTRQHLSKPPLSARPANLQTGQRAAHLTAMFQTVNTCRNRCFCASPSTNQPVSGAAHYADLNGGWEGVSVKMNREFFAPHQKLCATGLSAGSRLGGALTPALSRGRERETSRAPTYNCPCG